MKRLRKLVPVYRGDLSQSDDGFCLALEVPARSAIPGIRDESGYRAIAAMLRRIDPESFKWVPYPVDQPLGTRTGYMNGCAQVFE